MIASTLYKLPRFDAYANTLAVSSQRLVTLRRSIMAMVAAGAVLLCLIHAFAWVGFYLLAAAAICYVPLVSRAIRDLAMTAPASKAFAAQNSMRYISSAKPNYRQHFLPAVAKLGLRERQEEIIKGSFGNHPLEMYVHTYRHMFARRYTRMAVRVYSPQLPKELPHVFLRNRQVDGGKGVLQRHFDDNQRVGLEGNFGKYFTVYTHRRMRSDVLSILAPNVMETLINSNTKFDVEIIGNRLYLYSGNRLPLPDDLREAFATMTVLMKHIDHRLKSWKHVIPNNKRYPYLVSRPGFGTMVLGGKYFNASWRAVLLFSGWSVLRISASPEYRPAKIIVLGLSTTVMIGGLLIFRHHYQLRNRNVAR